MLEWRNVIIVETFIGACCFMAWLAGGEQIGTLGPTFISFGVGVAGCIGLRAANQWAERTGTVAAPTAASAPSVPRRT